VPWVFPKFQKVNRLTARTRFWLVPRITVRLRLVIAYTNASTQVLTMAGIRSRPTIRVIVRRQLAPHIRAASSSSGWILETADTRMRVAKPRVTISMPITRIETRP